MSRIAVFVYDFPHLKSFDFLSTLATSEHEVAAVVAAPFRRLGLAPRQTNFARQVGDFSHPRGIAEDHGIPYLVRSHDSGELPDEIREIGAALGVVAGARILPTPLIDSLPLGILNFHPALLPASRGLDSWLWDLLLDRPLGVTAHLIDGRVDVGRLVRRVEIGLEIGDQLSDVSGRLAATANDLLLPAVVDVLGADRGFVDLSSSHPLQRRMTEGQIAQAADRLAERLRLLEPHE